MLEWVCDFRRLKGPPAEGACIRQSGPAKSGPRRAYRLAAVCTVDADRSPNSFGGEIGASSLGLPGGIDSPKQLLLSNMK